MASTHNVNIKFNANTTELKTANKYLKETEKRIAELRKGPITGTAAAEIKRLEAELEKTRKIIADLTKQQKKFTEEIKDSTAAAKKLAAEEARVDAAALRRAKSRQEARTGIATRTERALGQSFLEAPLYSISFATMAGIASAVKQFVEFDKVLTRIGIVTGRNAESMKLFATYANDTGKALGATGKAFAEASLIFLQQGGRAADNAESLAAASIKLANITGVRAEDTSEYVTAIANSFNLLEKDAGKAGDRIVDMLSALDAASGSSADEIAMAFKRSASSFAAAGFSAEEAATMIAVVSETTRQASEMVGTGFKTLIGNLSEVKIGSKETEEITNQLDKVAQQFGISFSLINQYTGQMKGVKEILAEVAQIYNSTTNVAARNALVEAIAGKEQRDRFIALITNQERYNELLGIAQSSSGAADRANSRYLDSVGAKIEQLKNEWEDLIESLLDTEGFKGLIDGLTKITAAFSNMVASGNGALRVITSIVGALGPLATTKFFGGSRSIAVGDLFDRTRGGTRTKMLGEGGNRKAAGEQATGLYGGASRFFGGGASNYLTPDQLETYRSLRGVQFSKLKPKQKEELSTLQGQVTSGKIGNALIGGITGLAGSLGQLMNVFTTQNLTNSEKAFQSIGALAPAIGGLFGPAGAAAGAIVGMLIPALFGVNEAAQKVRDEMDKLKAAEEEAFATRESRGQIEDLFKQISSPYADKNSQAYINAANKLAELLPSISLGTDQYGNAIIKSTEVIKEHIEILKEEIKLKETLNYLEAADNFEAAQKIIKANKGKGLGSFVSSKDVFSGKMLDEAKTIDQAAVVAGVGSVTTEYGTIDQAKLSAVLDDIIKNPTKYTNAGIDVGVLQNRLSVYGESQTNIRRAETTQAQALNRFTTGNIQGQVESGAITSEQGAIQTRKFGALMTSENIEGVRQAIEAGTTPEAAFQDFYNQNINAIEQATQKFINDQNTITGVLANSVGRSREDILNALTYVGISKEDLTEQNWVAIYADSLGAAFEKMDDLTKSDAVKSALEQMKENFIGAEGYLSSLSISGQETKFIEDIMLNAENSREAFATLLAVNEKGMSLNTRMQELFTDGSLSDADISVLNNEGAPYFSFSRKGTGTGMQDISTNLIEDSFDNLRKKVEVATAADPEEVFFKILYNTENIELLKTKYEAIQGILEETLDAHESIIEKSIFESEIQDEIEKTTNQVYKNNLKTLNTAVQGAKLDRLSLQTAKDKLNLLKKLNQAGAQESPFRLTRLDSGRFRFKQTTGNAEEARTLQLQAVADYEKKTRETYVQTSEQVTALDFAIYDTISKLKDIEQGSAEEGELKKTLEKQKERRDILAGELTAYTPEMIKASYTSALVEKGKTDVAQSLIAGGLTVADIDKMGIFTPEEISNITSSVGDVQASVVTSNYDLTLTNAKLTEAVNAAIQAMYALKGGIDAAAKLPYENKTGILPGEVEKAVFGQYQFGGGPPNLNPAAIAAVTGTNYRPPVPSIGSPFVNPLIPPNPNQNSQSTTSNESKSTVVNIANLSLPNVVDPQGFYKEIYGMSNNAGQYKTSNKSASGAG